MKNKILLFATLLLVSIGAFASNKISYTTTHATYYNNYGNSFTFVERGVTFAIFQNGEFDFYINQRNGLNIGYQNRGVNISFNSGYNYDAYVQYDDYGAIIQIENIPIYYDYYGRVERVGSVDVNYYNGRLARLGDLRVYYDRNGYYSHYSGFINLYNRRYVYHPHHNYFSRPLFDFRIVSYEPYRHNYKVNRYKYHSNHSKNNYYGRNQDKHYKKRSTTNTRQRIATQQVPKRKDHSIARVDRNSTSRNYSNYAGNIRDRKDGSVSNSAKRDSRPEIGTIKTRSTSKKSSPIISRTQERKSLSSSSAVQHKPVRTQKNRKATTARQVSSKSANSRQPLKTKANKNSTHPSSKKSSKIKESNSKTVNRRRG